MVNLDTESRLRRSVRAALLVGYGLDEVATQLRAELRRLGHDPIAEIHAGIVEEGPAFHHLRVARPVALGVLMRSDPTRWAPLPRAPVST